MRVELGAVTLASEISSRQERHSSIALFCPVCGQVWGRICRGKGWYSLARACGQCRFNEDINGSFFQRFDWLDEPLGVFLTKHPQLLQYEFNVHLMWAERFLGRET